MALCRSLLMGVFYEFNLRLYCMNNSLFFSGGYFKVLYWECSVPTPEVSGICSIKQSGNLKLWDCVQDFFKEALSRNEVFYGMKGNVLSAS